MPGQDVSRPALQGRRLSGGRRLEYQALRGGMEQQRAYERWKESFGYCECSHSWIDHDHAGGCVKGCGCGYFRKVAHRPLKLKKLEGCTCKHGRLYHDTLGK